MKRVAICVVSAGVLAVTAVVSAGVAAAEAAADDTVNALKADGYVVQLNETPTANLSACTVTGVTKDTGGANPTAYVDISCPTGC